MLLIAIPTLLMACATLGIVPLTGVVTPFLSYGGSSLVTLMAGLGLVINVNMRRFSKDRIPNF